MKTGKIILIAGCAVGGLVLAGAGYLLYAGISDLQIQTKALEDAMNARGRYYRNDPFPSPENVEMEKRNSVAIQAAFTNLLARLGEGQVVPPQLTPSTFMRMLGQKKVLLMRAAASSADKDFATALPENPSFGFGPYFAGELRPKPEHVRELTLQLLILERLFMILFEERVDEVLSVRRDVFEIRKPGEKRAEASREETDLFTRQHFVFTCRAREAALIRVLNRLAADRMFVVVTALNVKKEAPDVLEALRREEEAPAAEQVRGIAEMLGVGGEAQAATPAADQPKRKPEDLLRDERVVCGHRREVSATVVLELDVYRFKGD